MTASPLAPPTPSAVPPHPPIQLPSHPSSSYRFSYRRVDTSTNLRPTSHSYGEDYIGDYETMRQMRVECGWGLERLEKEWKQEGYPFWIFYLRPSPESSSVADDETEERRNTPQKGDIVVGMGGLVLDLKDDQGMASEKEGRVKLASLFIYNTHRSLSLGRLSFLTLENLATSLYSARHLTLDTMPFEVNLDKEAINSDGRKVYGRPKRVEVGDEEGEARNMKWYKKMGYREFTPRKEHMYQNPFIKDPDDPDCFFPAAYLAKAVEGR